MIWDGTLVSWEGRHLLNYYTLNYSIHALCPNIDNRKYETVIHKWSSKLWDGSSSKLIGKGDIY